MSRILPPPDGVVEAPLGSLDPPGLLALAQIGEAGQLAACSSVSRPRSRSSCWDLPWSLRPRSGRCSGWMTTPAWPGRQRLLPVPVQGEDPEREPDDEGGPHRPPGAGAGPIDQDPDRAGEHRGAHEPLAPDELLRSDPAGDVDQVATGGGADHGQEQAPEHRKADVHTLLGADDGVPGQGEGGHELEDPLTEELAPGVGDLVADEAESDREQDVCRVGERRRHLTDQDVAGNATTEAAEDRHEDDADHGELLVVIRPPGEQGAVQGVGAGRDQVDGGEVTGPFEAADRNARGEMESVDHMCSFRSRAIFGGLGRRRAIATHPESMPQTSWLFHPVRPRFRAV